MKVFKIIIIFALSIFFMIGCMGLNFQNNSSTTNADYLRLHIRANSNLEKDQDVKYKVKNKVLDVLTKDVSNIKSKTELENYILNSKNRLQGVVDNVLKENGFNYISNIIIKNEYFPTRTYNNVTLNSGFYDAIIIELGKAEGNNWWCVAYPPLCFVYESSNLGNITYKSKLYELIKKFFKE